MKNTLILIKNFINKTLFNFGYRISKVNNTGELVKIHKYKDYEEYKETQIFHYLQNYILFLIVKKIYELTLDEGRKDFQIGNPRAYKVFSIHLSFLSLPPLAPNFDSLWTIEAHAK